MLAPVSGGQPTMGGGGGTTTTVPGTTPGGGTYYAPPDEFNDAALQYADAQNAYNRALIRYNQQRSGLLRQYGYAGDVDPTTGMLKNVRVDTANSYGLLQRMLHNQAMEDQSAVNAAEDRGIFGGLAHQGESELKYQHAGQSADLAGQLQSSLGDIDAQQLDAKTALDQALWQLTHQATQTAVDNGEFNPADLTDLGDGSDTSGGGSTASASKKKAISMIGSIPTKTATKLVKRAIAKGEPVSEHGLGQMKSPTKPAAKAPAKPAPKKTTPNAYTSGKKKRG